MYLCHYVWQVSQDINSLGNKRKVVLVLESQDLPRTILHQTKRSAPIQQSSKAKMYPNYSHVIEFHSWKLAKTQGSSWNIMFERHNLQIGRVATLQRQVLLQATALDASPLPWCFLFQCCRIRHVVQNLWKRSLYDWIPKIVSIITVKC